MTCAGFGAFIYPTLTYLPENHEYLRVRSNLSYANLNKSVWRLFERHLKAINPIVY